VKSYGIIKRSNRDLKSLKKLPHIKCFLVMQIVLTQEWVDIFERPQLALRLLPMLRERYGD
jgi:hypothetical protein